MGETLTTVAMFIAFGAPIYIAGWIAGNRADKRRASCRQRVGV